MYTENDTNAGARNDYHVIRHDNANSDSTETSDDLDLFDDPKSAIPHPVKSFCNKSRALHILKMSSSRFAKLGVLPVQTVNNPNGYGGKEYLYDLNEINGLSNNPTEIDRRIQAFMSNINRPALKD